MEAARRFRQELRSRGQVVLGGEKREVAKIGGQERQLGLDIGAVAIPAEEAMDGTGVTKVMDAGTVTALATTFPAHETQEVGDPVLHADVAVPTTARAPKHRRLGVSGCASVLATLEVRVEAGQ